jgi:hypothetical protein
MSNNLLSQANGQAVVAQVTIREANASDAGALRRLAELDSGRVPAEPVLVAEVGDDLHAAVSMSTGDVIADPFHPTQEVVQMIRLHKQTTRTGLFGPSRQRPAPSAPGIPGFPVIPAR